MLQHYPNDLDLQRRFQYEAGSQEGTLPLVPLPQDPLQVTDIQETTYHDTHVPYVIPNNGPEHSRLDEQHDILVEMMQGDVIAAPLRNPRRILDVGCGTGIVTCHLGKTFPHAEVYGIDLSPIPITHAPPANVLFCKGIMPDVANPGDDPRFVAGSFDFVFSRLLIMGMNKWQDYVSAAAKLLQPGGLVEFQELDTRFYIDGTLCDEQWEWAKIFHKEAAKRGLDLQCGSHMEEYIHGAGLEVVEVKRYRWPYGDWLAKAGYPETLNAGLHMITGSIPMIKGMVAKMMEDDYSPARIAEVQAELAERIESMLGVCPMYVPWTVTVGRKPSGSIIT